MFYRFYFLFATLFTLPFAIRKVLWVDPAPYFKEYSDISIYLFEIFALVYVLIYILEHKKEIKSIIQRMFHVEHFLILVLISLSTLLAALLQERYFGFYLLIRWVIYIFFGISLYKDLIHIVPRGTFDNTHKNCSTWNILNIKNWRKLLHVEHSPINKYANCSTWNNLKLIFLFSLIIQALIVLFQVLSQNSLGLFYLGEGILDPAIAGVATIIVSGRELLRGYGTFLHPNIAAFFFFTYGILYILLKIVPRGTFQLVENSTDCSTWNILNIKNWRKLFHVEHIIPQNISKIVPRGTIVLIYIVILLGFLLTLSKSVIFLAVIIGIVIWYLTNCSTWNISKLFHVEHSSKIIKIVPRGTLIILVAILGIVALSIIDKASFIYQSILERKLQYLSIPVSSFIDVLVGQGLGSYVELLSEKSPGLFLWQLQPIHNTYILWVFELGLLPILGILLFLFVFMKKNTTQKLKKKYSLLQKSIVVIFGGVALLLLIDHYTWDIEQGQFLFVLLITTLLFALRLPLPKDRE